MTEKGKVSVTMQSVSLQSLFLLVLVDLTYHYDVGINTFRGEAVTEGGVRSLGERASERASSTLGNIICSQR